MAVARVLARTFVDPFGCWRWLGGTTDQGYGAIAENGRTLAVHRVVYVALVGPVPDGLVLDHLCRLRSCVNPLHLEPVTIAENVRRGFALIPKRTHCPRGHAYAEHGRRRRDGAFDCRPCDNDRPARKPTNRVSPWAYARR